MKTASFELADRDSEFYLHWAIALFLAAFIFSIIGAWATYQSRQPTLATADAHFLDLYHENGHFRTTGSINGVPTRFLVDTGASYVSITQSLANRIGIRACSEYRMTQTANGPVNACKSIVGGLVFGPFRFASIEVLIMPNMQEEVLLGMNALSCFRMEQQEGRLRLVNAHGACRINNSNASIDPSTEARWITLTRGALIWGMSLFLFWWWKRRKHERKSAAAPITSRARRPKNDYYNPKEFRAERPCAPSPPNAAPPRMKPSAASSNAKARLLTACCGDKARMERLMEYESRKAPFISDSEAAKRALERLVRDRS